MRIIFGQIWVFWQIRKVLADKENWRWRPESPFFSLCCNVFQWVKSASCVRMEWIPETWKLKGTTKVQKCICDEIRLNNIDILLLVFVVIVTFRVCEWKREKSRKSFCGYFTSSWSGRGSFCNHRNLVWNKKKKTLLETAFEIC